MTPALQKFTVDLHEDRVSRASLFWLRNFIKHAKNGVLRSDSWVEAGLREAQEIPGLDATDLSPRLTLLT
ncbi:MAG: hypothetical protein R3264_15595, partial [Anaerolineae bacterium]|nr:hypothetical protein [Anaerolineae bacterium]